jgi:hypothetical protein
MGDKGQVGNLAALRIGWSTDLLVAPRPTARRASRKSVSRIVQCLGLPVDGDNVNNWKRKGLDLPER